MYFIKKINILAVQNEKNLLLILFQWRMTESLSLCMYILPSLFAFLVGEAILPGPVVATEKWRMIHFKYRKKRSMMHVMDGYDVSQPTTRQHQVLHTCMGLFFLLS